MKNWSASTIKIFQIFLLSFGCLLTGCSNQKDQGRDKTEEANILRKISHNTLTAQRIDEIVGKNATRICLQGKYIPKEEIFEKSVGRPVNKYKEIGDKQLIIWWIFDKNDRSYWVEIPEEIAVLSRDTEFICHDSNNMIYFSKNGQQLMYNFERK